MNTILILLFSAYSEALNMHVHPIKVIDYSKEYYLYDDPKLPESIRKQTINVVNPSLSRELTKIKPIAGSNISSHAGFINANPKLGARLFFWFFESEKNPSRPVIVWLQGQPGFSSLYSLFEEHGPYYIKNYKTLEFGLRKFAWTKEYNVLYLDHCIGCGFSFGHHWSAYKQSLDNVGHNIYQALTTFFQVFNKYTTNDFYLAGEYACAKYIPVVANTINMKNLIGSLRLNLKGMIIGGPYIDTIEMARFREYMYITGLIDTNYYEIMGPIELYAEALIRASMYDKAVKYLKKYVYSRFERSGFNRMYDLRYNRPIREDYVFEHYMKRLVNSTSFLAMLRMEKANFETKSSILIKEMMPPVDRLVAGLLDKYSVLYYSGQFDMMSPISNVNKFLHRFKWTGLHAYYSAETYHWYPDNSTVVSGYWKTAFNLTHLTVRNSGHTFGTIFPGKMFSMLQWFVDGKFNPKAHTSLISVEKLKIK